MDPIDKLLDALQFWAENEATIIDMDALATDDTEETMGDLIAAALAHRKEAALAAADVRAQAINPAALAATCALEEELPR